MDTYRTYAHLAASTVRGVDYEIETADRRSSVVVVAPHGGGIEPGTAEIARAIAGDALSYYTFLGLRPSSRNRELHITSTRFDEPTCVDLVRASRSVLTIHGARGDSEFFMAGGRDADSQLNILDSLTGAGFVPQAPRADIAGIERSNICNQGRSGMGVQLELSRALRDALRDDPTRMSRFAGAIRSVLA